MIILKKILIGYVTENTGSGINKFLNTVFHALKDEKVHIDLLSCSYNEEMIQQYTSKGLNIIKISRLVSPIKRYIETKNIVQSTHYDIIYFNISESFNCICNIAAKKYSKNSVIITHSHSAGNDDVFFFSRLLKKAMNRIFQPVVVKNTDYFFACSMTAGYWAFGRSIASKIRVIRNMIDLDRFYFKEEPRNTIRKQLQLNDNDVLLGFVGNFNYQKNPLFLIDVFKEYCRINSNSYLLMLGKGILDEKIQKKIDHYKLSDRVFMPGQVNNVDQYMAAMDAFVFPSRFEGLGIVGVEAQASGLFCLFSDQVPNEVKISDNCKFLSLTLSSKEWAQEIVINKNREDVNLDYSFILDSKRQDQEFKDIFINGLY